MHVLITGITGFIGRRLARRLSEAGHRVTGLAMDQPEIAGVDEVLLLNVLDLEGLREAIDRLQPDAVVHLAGLSHVGESWKRPGDYLRVNFIGARNVAMAAEGRRILFASSAEVYGKVPEDEQPIVEDRPLDPRSPYAMTKACAEQVMLVRGAIIVRSFNAIGAGQGSQFALPSFAAQLAAIGRGEVSPVIRVGDLSPRRDFVHVGDTVAGFELLTQHEDAVGVYNLASGRATSIAEALDGLRQVSGVQAAVERDEARVRPVDLPVLCGSAARIEALGWERKFSLEDALAELWEETQQTAGG